MSNKPHDALFRDTFAQPEHARGELMHLLPAALSARLDWSTLTLSPSSYVDEALADSQSDLLFTIQLDHQDQAFLYLLFEHQSTADPMLLFRQLKYEVRIWDDWLQAHPRARKLPVIVPLLLCHTPEGWSGATHFEELLDLDESTLALVRDFVPRFRALVDDLSLQSDEELRTRSMTALSRVVLWCLKTARSTDDWLDGVVAWGSLLHAAHSAPNGAAAMALIWRYLFTVHEAPKQRVLPALAAVLKQEQKKDMASIADQLIEEGMQQGIQKGMQQGIQKGMQQGIEQGERAVLVRQLQRRFGPLPQEAQNRLAQATLAELEQWADRVLTAASLAEVVGTPSK